VQEWQRDWWKSLRKNSGEDRDNKEAASQDVEKRSGEDNEVSEDKTDREYWEGVAKYCDEI
jgi:hypothetical protein